MRLHDRSDRSLVSFFEFFQLRTLALQFQCILFVLLIEIALLLIQRLNPIADRCTGSHAGAHRLTVVHANLRQRFCQL